MITQFGIILLRSTSQSKIQKKMQNLHYIAAEWTRNNRNTKVRWDSLSKEQREITRKITKNTRLGPNNDPTDLGSLMIALQETHADRYVGVGLRELLLPCASIFCISLRKSLCIYIVGFNKMPW